MDFLKHGIALLFVITCTHCKVAQVATVPPFTIVQTTSAHWFGGLPGVEGDLITITYTAKSPVDFDSMSYQGRTVSVAKYQKKGVKTVVGNFKTTTRGGAAAAVVSSVVPSNKKDIVLYYRIKEQKASVKLTVLNQNDPIFYQ